MANFALKTQVKSHRSQKGYNVTLVYVVQWKLYHEFLALTQLFTRQSLENPAQQEVVAPSPWHVQLWLVDADCAFCDPASPTESD
jgi:hypothetical protein